MRHAERLNRIARLLLVVAQERVLTTQTNADVEDRRAAMAVLAEGRLDEIEPGIRLAAGDVGYVELRAAETGLVMLRGRIGGDGAPFNLGEATVTRAAVRIDSGETGIAYVLGRDREKARLSAVCDALWQNDGHRDAVERCVLSTDPCAAGCRAHPGARADRGDARGLLHPRARRGLSAVPATVSSSPALASQAVFRTIMDAMARPGEVLPLPLGMDAAGTAEPLRPPPWCPLCSTTRRRCGSTMRSRPARRSPSGSASRPARGSVTEPQQASFAIIADPAHAPPFDDFSLGTGEYPDRSTTLVLQVERFGQGREPVALRGPGIAGERDLFRRAAAGRYRGAARRQSRAVSRAASI